MDEVVLVRGARAGFAVLSELELALLDVAPVDLIPDSAWPPLSAVPRSAVVGPTLRFVYAGLVDEVSFFERALVVIAIGHAIPAIGVVGLPAWVDSVSSAKAYFTKTNGAHPELVSAIAAGRALSSTDDHCGAACATTGVVCGEVFGHVFVLAG